jgi:tetratricopeptide (TPR) repeat protein
MAVNRRSVKSTTLRPWLPIVLFFIVVGTFLSCLRNGFVNLDDQAYVTQNVHVKEGLTRDSLSWIWGDTQSSNWHPLTWVSHMLDSELFGMHPEGHHATSVLLHALNTVLLFLVFRKMTGAPWRSFAMAALFGVHPLRVESVAWISERKDVLSGLFWMLTLWAYARYAGETENSSVHKPVAGQSSRPKLFYGAALVLFALGLLAKPMLVTVPFVLLLLDYWPLGRWPRLSLKRLLWEKVPFFALAAASSIVTVIAQQRGGSVTPMDTLSLSARLGNAIVSYIRYLGMNAWPVDLCVMYPHPGHWPVSTVIGAGLVLTAVTGIVLWQWRRLPYLAFGWFWFLGVLVPTIGLVQVGRQALADRYTYLPSIGLWTAVVWGGFKWIEHWRHREILGRAVTIVAIGIYMVLTILQIGYWKNSETLFRHAMLVTKRNWIVATSLGDQLQSDGQTDQAMAMYQEAITINPYHAEVWYKLGLLFLNRGQFDQAVPRLQKAVALEPDDIYARKGLGAALQDMGRLDEAIDQFNQVVRLKPSDADAYSNLGNCYGMKGQLNDAIRCLNQAVKLKPNSAQNHRELGVGLANNARWNEAIDQFQQAINLDPSDTQAKADLDAANQAKARTNGSTGK